MKLDLKKCKVGLKTKIVPIRVTEEEFKFMKDNDISRSALFREALDYVKKKESKK